MEYLSSNLLTAYPFQDHTDNVFDTREWEATLIETDGVFSTSKVPVVLFADVAVSSDVTLSGAWLQDFEYAPDSAVFRFTFRATTDLGTYTFTSPYTPIPESGDFVRVSQYEVRGFSARDEEVWPDTKASGSVFVRCVLSARFLRELVAAGRRIRITPSLGLALELKTIFCRPRSTLPLSFYIADPSITEADNVVPPDRVSPYLTGVIGLESGTNTKLEAGTGTITISSSAGAGTGTAPCNSQSNAPKGISVGDKGDLKLTSDACHTLVPHVPSQSLIVFGNCDTCCSCDRFKNFFVALKRYGIKLDATWDKLDLMKDTYAAG